MKTLSDKINESLKESYTERDEDIDSLIDIIEISYVDYFSEDATPFETERMQIGNFINRKIIFQINFNDYKSFKETVVSIVTDFNNKMKSMGKDEISATWMENDIANILELS